MRKRNVRAAIAAALCMTVLAAGCGKKADDPVFTGDKTEAPVYQANLDAIKSSVYASADNLDLEPGTYISVIGRGSSTPYWNQVKAGVEQAATDLNTALGYSGNDKVKVLYSAPDENDNIDQQVNILDEELARYPDVIAISSVDASACSVQFDLAIENGIPIVAFDSGTDYQNIVSMIDTDNTTAAATAASKLCNSIGESGQILVIAHDSKSTSSEEREQGFVQEVEKNDPNVTVAEIWHLDDLDAIAVTYGPGLVGALLVGVAEAKAISYAKNLPLVGVHHIEGHISANYIEHPDLEPPFLCLIVSGGHTHLVIVKDYGEFEILGRTHDDAAGEAFDKVARAIGLGYPGGPKIDKLSKEGDPDAIPFPRAHIEDSPYDFSFSGVKSAVLNYINGCKMKGIEYNRADIAASFQKAVTDVLVDNAMHAVKEYGLNKFAIAGGVASNSSLRAAMKQACEKNEIEFYYPSPIFCTDNAAMIGVAAYYEYINGTRHGWDLNAVPNLKLGER